MLIYIRSHEGCVQKDIVMALDSRFKYNAYKSSLSRELRKLLDMGFIKTGSDPERDEKEDKRGTVRYYIDW